MAKQREVARWITVNGKHVPIFEGESKKEAISRALTDPKTGKKKSFSDEVQSDKTKDEKEKEYEDWKKSLADKRDKDLGQDKKEKYKTLRKEVDDAYDKAVRSAKNEDYREFKRLHDELEKMKTSDGQKSSFGKETNDKISNYQDKFLKGKSDKQIQEIKDNLEKSGKIIGTSEQDHIALAAIRKEQEARKSSTKSSKDNDNHYDTKLNDIRERMRSGHMTPEQAKNEAFEYEKSQRGNKKWSDVDRNRMESKVRDIFDEADTRKSSSKETDNSIAYKKNWTKEQALKEVEDQLTYHYKHPDLTEGEEPVLMSKDGRYTVARSWKDADYAKKYGWQYEPIDKETAAGIGERARNAAKSNTQKQISKDLDTKEKQIAQNKAEVDRLNGKTTSKGLDNYLKKHNLSMDEVYKEIKNNPKMKATANELLKDGMEYDQASAMAYEQHMNKNAGTKSSKTKATTMADLKKQALAAGYSKEKIQGMTKAQLKKLLG